ncbi:hypothetical Protein YC6258_05166 [Gynuella sunshinyii YC6258]|uniref:Uncharacterized protein n=1 Tax=Gynuella sunshinyii YC6258 TaxID=1445510 RepID=A0A0C5VSK2_9GAMM|nr:hypothetical Protein YC6258_05166 [Gynuella sunshinyii YC6258]
MPVFIYLANIGVGFIVLFSAYFTGSKLKSLNKRLQPTIG